jgi:hypothetical protein
VEATAGFEPAIEVLQTSALPLGYVALTLGILADSPLIVKPSPRDNVLMGNGVHGLDAAGKGH